MWRLCEEGGDVILNCTKVDVGTEWEKSNSNHVYYDSLNTHTHTHTHTHTTPVQLHIKGKCHSKPSHQVWLRNSIPDTFVFT